MDMNRLTVGYIFSFGALIALGLISWFYESGPALFVFGLPAVLVAGVIGALCRNHIVGRNLAYAAFAGGAVSLTSVALYPLVLGALMSLGGRLDALGGGIIGMFIALIWLGLPISAFGALTGSAVNWIARRHGQMLDGDEDK